MHSSDWIFLRLHPHISRLSDCELAFLLFDHFNPCNRPAQLHSTIRTSCPHGCWTLGIKCAVPFIRVVSIRFDGAGSAGNSSSNCQRNGQPGTDIWCLPIPFGRRPSVHDGLWSDFRIVGFWSSGLCCHACFTPEAVRVRSSEENLTRSNGSSHARNHFIPDIAQIVDQGLWGKPAGIRGLFEDFDKGSLLVRFLQALSS